jgi:hypothetical protein
MVFPPMSHKVHSMVMVLMVIFTFATIYCLLDVNGRHFKGLPREDSSFLSYLYFSMSTQTTLGASDMTPSSQACRALMILQMLTTLMYGLHLIIG